MRGEANNTRQCNYDGAMWKLALRQFQGYCLHETSCHAHNCLIWICLLPLCTSSHWLKPIRAKLWMSTNDQKNSLTLLRRGSTKLPEALRQWCRSPEQTWQPLEMARKQVSDEGYVFKKGQSRSKAYGCSGTLHQRGQSMISRWGMTVYWRGTLGHFMNASVSVWNYRLCE